MIENMASDLILVYLHGVAFNIVLAIEVYVKGVWKMFNDTHYKRVSLKTFMSERLPTLIRFILLSWLFWTSTPHTMRDLE